MDQWTICDRQQMFSGQKKTNEKRIKDILHKNNYMSFVI